MDIREKNVLANQYAREISDAANWSPFRLKQYVDARIAGKTPRQAYSIATTSRRTESIVAKPTKDCKILCNGCRREFIIVLEPSTPEAHPAAASVCPFCMSKKLMEL